MKQYEEIYFDYGFLVEDCVYPVDLSIWFGSKTLSDK
jgi:hypothetical protein